MTTPSFPRSRSFLHTLTPGPLALSMRAGVDPSGWLALPAWGRRRSAPPPSTAVH